jgi:FtsP/CotA-like multicopper oxidase with cupredoxin domain
MRVLRAAAVLLLLFPALSTASCQSGAPADAAAVKDINVTVVNRQVTPPPARIAVAKGQTVRITVRTDVTDVVHVHGYDKSAALMPDKPATIEFVADQDGVFQVETHGTKLQLFQLAVS